MKILSEEPTIHPDAVVIDSKLGAWTEVQAHSQVSESEMGDYSYVTQYCRVHWATLGKFVNIANFTRINPGNHPTWRVTLHHFTYRSRQYQMGGDDQDFFNWRKEHWVTIGHDTWLGQGSTILAGRKVGTGAVVGAGAVVTKDVEPFTVVAGVPAKVIKLRFPKDVQEGLMSLAWWDWSHEKLKEALPDMRSMSAQAFIRKYGD
jgi:phosphonate metabolism protein (transferase hexapeptide repeat family)